MRNLNKYLPAAVLAVLFLFHAVNNYIWLSLNNVPPHDDLAYHLAAALDIMRGSNGLISMIARGMNYVVVGFYQPLFHIAMAVFNLIFGETIKSATMANSLFILMLLVSVYYTGKRIGDRNAGLLAAFIVMMYPYVFALSRVPLIDFALTAMVALNFCFLLYSDSFSHEVHSLLYGVTFGLGMLTKQVFIFFAVAPLLFTVGSILVNKRSDVRSWSNLVISLLLAFLIPAYWYLPRLKDLIPRYFKAAAGPDTFSSGSFIYYFTNLINNQLLSVFFGVFVVACVLWFISRGKTGPKLLLASAIAGAYLFFSLILNKHMKTTTPCLPFFALVSAIGLTGIRNTIVKRSVILLVVVVALVQYFDLSYGSSTRSRTLSFEDPAPPFGISFRPVKADFGVEALFDTIQKESKKDIVTLYTTRQEWESYNEIITNKELLTYYGKANNLKLSFARRSPITGFVSPAPDFLVLASTSSVDLLAGSAATYKLIRSVTMPDSSSVFLYEALPFPRE